MLRGAQPGQGDAEQVLAGVPQLIEGLKARGVLAAPWGAQRVRFVTHLDVDDDGIDRAAEALRALSPARV